MDPRLARAVADPGTDRAVGLWSDLGAHAHADPTAFNDRVLWWRDALLSALRAGALPSPGCTPLTTRAEAGAPKSPLPPSSRLVLHVDESLRRLWTRGDVGRPLGLGAVMENLSSQGDLCSYRTFLASATPIRLLGSAAGKGRSKAAGDGRSLPRRAAGAVGGMAASAAMAALTAALGALGLGGEEGGDEESDSAWDHVQGDWVASSLLSSAAREVQDAHFARAGLSPLDLLYTKDEVARLLLSPVLTQWSSALGEGASAPPLAQQDLDLVLLHLSRDLQVVSIQDNVVKFSARPGERVSPVSKHEQDIVQVRLTHSLLEAQVASLQSQVDTCTERAKKAVAAKQASTAKVQLKTRKMLLEVLDKRLGAEHNLSTVLLKLDQASTDAKLAETYESASTALASVLADPRLQLDRIEKTMDSLQEGVQDAQAVSDAISAAAPGAEDIDEDEIAEELAELEKEAQPVSTTAPTPVPAPISERPSEPVAAEAVPSQPAQHPANMAEAQAQPRPGTPPLPEPAQDPLPHLPSVPQHAPGKEAPASEPERASTSASTPVQAEPTA